MRSSASITCSGTYHTQVVMRMQKATYTRHDIWQCVHDQEEIMQQIEYSPCYFWMIYFLITINMCCWIPFWGSNSWETVDCIFNICLDIPIAETIKKMNVFAVFVCELYVPGGPHDGHCFFWKLSRENNLTFQAEHKLPYVLWVCTHGTDRSLVSAVVGFICWMFFVLVTYVCMCCL